MGQWVVLKCSKMLIKIIEKANHATIVFIIQLYINSWNEYLDKCKYNYFNNIQEDIGLGMKGFYIFIYTLCRITV